MNDTLKNMLLWFVIAIVLMSFFSNFSRHPTNTQEIAYSEFVKKVQTDQVKQITIDGQTIKGVYVNGQMFNSYMPLSDPGLISDLLKHNVDIKGKPPEHRGLLMQLFISWFPVLLFIGVWIFFMRQMQGGGGKGGALSFGKSKARLLGEDQIKITFADVAGVEEAKEDVVELVEFLRDPTKFQRLGGRMPSGVLMIGPPGTGKTLLAKAIAGEAKVPFFTISGSDFVEMFVGVGASRVRDMFEQAKKQAPCIIFIDEIDAVGRHRGAGVGGGHDEREQTLNQLLVEMDGFEGNEGVIVIAATNRPDVLDPALLRPGRFDRQVVVGLPDIRGREQILKVHMRKVSTADDVKPIWIARGTPGFSGADLANIVNEAALLASRGNKKKIDMEEFESAKDKIMMGAERRSMVMSEDEKKLTAYHESGHTIVGSLLVPNHDPVYKVTIIPRGLALGVTMNLPEEDRHSYSKIRLESMIASLFGGRIAEELIFGAEKVTTGASNDIEKATELARNMVTKWGLSEKLGPLQYAQEEQEVFLGHSVSQKQEISETTAAAIDNEIKVIIDKNYQIAEKLLKDNKDKLHIMAKALIKYETLDADQIKAIMADKEPGEPKSWKGDPDLHNDDESSDEDKNKKSTKSEKKVEQNLSKDLNNPLKDH